MAPLDLFRCLPAFMKWSKRERRQRYLELCEELANRIDTAHSTVDGMRELLRKYSERSGKLRWTAEEIDSMSVTTCRRHFQDDIHVNIHHFIDGSDQQFDSYAALKAHTIAHSLFFPLVSAKADGLTRLLLKDFSSRQGQGGGGGLARLMGGLTL